MSPLEEFKAEKMPAQLILKKSFVIEKLKLIKSYFKAKKPLNLRIMANELINTAVIRNDKVIARLCLIAYSLHKFLSKVHFAQNTKAEKNFLIILNALDKTIDSVKEHDETALAADMDKFAFVFEKIDVESNNFFQSLYSKAKVKYAADAFYLGMSLSTAAQLTGANIGDLQKYVSFTKQFEVEPKVIGISERLKKLEEMIS